MSAEPVRTVELDTDHGVVRAKVRAPAERRGWALLVPGYLANADFEFFPALADALAARGIASVAVTLSGSGFDGAGRLTNEPAFAANTYAQELADLAAVADGIAAPAGLAPANGLVIGHSRGAAMGLLHATEVGGYRGFVGLAAGGHVGRFRPERVAAWRRDGRLPYVLPDGRTWHLTEAFLGDLEAHRGRYDLAHAASVFERPALFLHGARDRAVPIDEARAHAARFARGELRVVNAAGHTLRTRSPENPAYPWLEDAADFAAACLASTR